MARAVCGPFIRAAGPQMVDACKAVYTGGFVAGMGFYKELNLKEREQE